MTYFDKGMTNSDGLALNTFTAYNYDENEWKRESNHIGIKEITKLKKKSEE